jgi:hypothetical protein
MSQDFDPNDSMPDVVPTHPDFNEIPINEDVPHHLDVLPDGRETLVIGDPERCKDFNHPQGDNTLGYQGTCGLVSCEDVLRHFGVEVTEDDVVRYAHDQGLCAVSDELSQCGGTTELGQAQILTDMGVPAHPELSSSLEELASHVENGQGTIIEVNAGVLWNDANYFDTGQANHAIVVTGVARDPQTGDIQGFYVNDSGRGLPEDSGRFLETATMQSAWLDTGGSGVVTDAVQ